MSAVHVTVRLTGMVRGMLILLGVGVGACSTVVETAALAMRQESALTTVSGQIQSAPVWESPVESQSAPGGRESQNQSFDEPHIGQGKYEEAAMPYTGDEASGASSGLPIAGVRARNEQALMAIPGVVGIDIGQGPTGEHAIVVYILNPSVAQRVPRQADGHPIVTRVTGPIDAYGDPGRPSDPPARP